MVLNYGDKGYGESLAFLPTRIKLHLDLKPCSFQKTSSPLS